MIIEVIASKRDSVDSMLKKYKKKLEKISLLKKLKQRKHFTPRAEKRREQIQKAILTQRYKQAKGLV